MRNQWVAELLQQQYIGRGGSARGVFFAEPGNSSASPPAVSCLSLGRPVTYGPPARWPDACRLDLYMVAGRWLTRGAWHVAGSVLLSLCWCCHCFTIHTASSATCSPSLLLQHSGSGLSVGMTGHAPRSRRDRGGCCCSQHGSSDSRRARVAMGMEGAPGTTASAAGAALVLSRRIDEVVLPPGRGLRVHSLSDLHTDSKDNLAW